MAPTTSPLIPAHQVSGATAKLFDCEHSGLCQQPSSGNGKQSERSKQIIFWSIIVLLSVAAGATGFFLLGPLVAKHATVGTEIVRHEGKAIAKFMTPAMSPRAMPASPLRPSVPATSDINAATPVDRAAAQFAWNPDSLEERAMELAHAERATIQAYGKHPEGEGLKTGFGVLGALSGVSIVLLLMRKVYDRHSQALRSGSVNMSIAELKEGLTGTSATSGGEVGVPPSSPVPRTLSPYAYLQAASKYRTSAAPRGGSVSMTATLDKVETKTEAELKKEAQMKEEADMMMDSFRGRNLNDDDAAAEGLEMQLVDVERGEDELPLRYDPEALKAYFSKRPRAVAQRMLQLSTAFSGFGGKLALDAVLRRDPDDPELQTKRAAELRDLVTSLGPFFIKIGQALSIRPDILPPKSMVELQKLCDKVPSYDSKIAMQTLEEELGASVEELFSELTPEPIAAASLGQVYKGKLRKTGEPVAVKVQRPFVLETVSLDLYLMRETGLLLKHIPNTEERTDLVALVDEFAGRFYDELDYRLECENGIRIAEHMASLPKVLIPKNYPEYTSRRVHTAQWVDGEKLAQSKADDVGELVNVGVVVYLTQLLGEGFFHADPHPGNMIRTPDGRLCILDFGLMTEITDDQKYGMIESVVHLINRDYKDIGDDFKKLDFIPDHVDVEPIIPALTNVFDAALAGGGAKSINFNDLSADLAEITFEYPFRIPPYFALVIRAIGVLEGIALVGNPDFAIVDAAYPYISKRLLTDQSPRLRDALRYMVYGRDDTFDAERLIELLNAFEKFDIVSSGAGGISYGGGKGPKTGDGENNENMEEEKVSTALAFFFSPEGGFFREFLLDETVQGVDVVSRSTWRRLIEQVPGLKLLVPPPVLALAPELTPKDEKVLDNMIAVLDFFLNRSSTGADAPSSQGSPFRLGGTQIPLDQESLQYAQSLQPVFRKYAEPMRAFGIQVVGRLIELQTSRAFQYTRDLLVEPQTPALETAKR